MFSRHGLRRAALLIGASYLMGACLSAPASPPPAASPPSSSIASSPSATAMNTPTGTAPSTGTATATAIANPTATASETPPRTPSPTATPSSTPSQTPVPPTGPPVTTPPDQFERSAVVERDGVRVSISLEETPLRAGEPTWVTTRVVNVGDEDLIWPHDGCATSVGVSGVVEGVRWRPGVEQSGTGATFKEYALERSPEGAIRLVFVPRRYIGMGDYSCLDIGQAERIPPGGVIRQRAQWDGSAWHRLGQPPAGPVRLVGTFRYYWRPGRQPEDITSQTVEVSLDTWVENGDGAMRLDPPEVIDAALASELGPWLADREVGVGNEPLLRFDPDTDLWQVGLVDYRTERIHYVLVDPMIGEIVDTIDRPWDPEVDGFP